MASTWNTLTNSVTLPPILQCEIAILLKPLIFPSASLPHLCWNRQTSLLGELPLRLSSHCVFSECVLTAPEFKNIYIYYFLNRKLAELSPSLSSFPPEFHMSHQNVDDDKQETSWTKRHTGSIITTGNHTLILPLVEETYRNKLFTLARERSIFH